MGEGEDKEMTREDLISVTSTAYEEAELRAAFANFLKKLDTRFSGVHEIETKLKVFELYIMAHVPALVDPDDTGIEIGPGGLMANLSRALGKRLHYSECIHCGTEVDEPTHYKEFLKFGGRVDKPTGEKDFSGHPIFDAGNGTYGQGNKHCPNVESEEHNLTTDELKVVKIVLHKEAAVSFDRWRQDQEFLIRFVSGGTNNKPKRVVAETSDIPPEVAKSKEDDETPNVVIDSDSIGLLLQNLSQEEPEPEPEPELEESISMEEVPESLEKIEDVEEEIEESPRVEETIGTLTAPTGFEVPRDWISSDSQNRKDRWPLTAEEISRLWEHEPLWRKYFGFSFIYHPKHCGTMASSNPGCTAHNIVGSDERQEEVTMYINQPSSKVVTDLIENIREDAELSVELFELLNDASNMASRKVDSSLELMRQYGRYDSKRGGHTMISTDLSLQ